MPDYFCNSFETKFSSTTRFFSKILGLGGLRQLPNSPKGRPQLLNYILKKRLKILLTTLLMIGLRSIWLNLGHIEKLWFLLFIYLFIYFCGKIMVFTFAFFSSSKINCGE